MPETEHNQENKKKEALEFQLNQKVELTFLNKTGTVVSVVSGLRTGDPKLYEVLFDEPLTQGKNDNGPYRCRRDQLRLLE